MKTTIEYTDGTINVHPDEMPVFQQTDDGEGWEVSVMDEQCGTSGDMIPVAQVKRIVWEA